MVDDRTQQSDRPGRKVLTGIAIAACGGVIALLLEYFVIQPWLTAESKKWDTNAAPASVDKVYADGKITHADGRLHMTGELVDKADDNKGALLIILVDGKEYRSVPVTKGANETARIDEDLQDTVTIAVRECLTHQTRPAQDQDCSDPLTIWP